MDKGVRNGSKWALSVLDNWPDVPDRLGLYRRAFFDLHSSRPSTMSGAGAIGWDMIDRWAWRHGIVDAEDFDDLVYMVRAQDATFLEYQSEQQPRRNDDSDEHVRF